MGTWSVREARKEFAALLAAADDQPQTILRRGEPVAVVIAPDSAGNGGESVSDLLDRMHNVPADADGDGLPAVPRKSRPAGV